jgi:hypothetical protein
MAPLAGFDPTFVGQNIGIPVGLDSSKKITNPTKNAQAFLTGFAGRLLSPVVSAIQNKDLIQQAIKGNPSALSQAMINVGGATAGLPGAILIGTDQLLKRGLGKGIVPGTEDMYRQTQQPNFMPGAGRQGFGGLY